MNDFFKKTIAGLATIGILALMYLGAFLPLRKSQLYIRAMVDVQSGKVRTLQNFIDSFYPALDFYSPVGQDEVVSYYAGGILPTLMDSVADQPGGPQIIEALLQDLDKWIEPIIKSGKGFGFSQNLYNFGNIYYVAAEKLNSDAYLQKSIDFFNEGLKSSPGRDLFFEGLFRDYQLKGDKVKMREIGDIILKHWPDSEEIRKAMESL
ncbi:MAG: hypothetical protein WC475_03990 [Candidatus Paceibacterota bacterium]